MGALNADSRRFLDAAFGSADKAWLVRGHHDANDKLVVDEEGPAGTFDLPDSNDLYYCVGTVKGSRTAIERVWVLVIDDVGKEISREEFEWALPTGLEPSYWRESSSGSLQVGFNIIGGEDPEAFKARRIAMKAHPVWGKAHNISAAALYRLPQGTHTKSTRGGWKVREERWSGLAYTPSELDALIPAGVAKAAGGAPKAFEWTLGDKALQALVDLIPNLPGTSRDEWVQVAHGILGAGGGFEIFDSYAARWDNYDAADTQAFWDGIMPDQVRSGGGVLRALAEAADPSGFDLWKSEWEVKGVFDDGLVEPSSDAGAPLVFIEPVQREVADSVVTGHGHVLRFNHDSGCWHQFDGFVWEPLPKSVKAGFRLAERWAAMNAGNLKPGDFKAASKANFYDGVENILRQRLMVRQTDFNRDPWKLGTPGGTVDLRSGALMPPKASDFISKRCAVTPADFEDCPRFKKFLHEICKGDRGMMLFIQQWFGYNLSGDTSEQVFLFLYGPGGNGKSVLVDTLAWVAGTYFVKPVSDLYVKKTTVRHMQEVAMLAGARMVTISEVPAGSQWDEVRLKEHTGGGAVTANYMRENSFSFVPQFKLTALGNHQPTFPGGINPAIRRRFKMMLLDFVPKVADKTLEKIFQAEGPGILRWAINGLCDSKVGWHKTGLMVPQSVENVTDEYVADQDILAAWLGDRTEKKTGALTGVEILWRDFIEYRNAHDSTIDIYSTTRVFSMEMERRGLTRRRSNAGQNFYGIVLKSKAKEAFGGED